MYLRHTTLRKYGKTHTYWRLVRSVRCGRNVRQETVAMLGELDPQGRLKAQALAKHLLGRSAPRGLFPDDLPAEPIPARLDLLGVERGRRFGDVWLALQLWRALGLDGLLERLLPRGREEISWAEMAAVLVIARLCEPSSELHLAEDWYRRTALEDLLGIPAHKVNEDRLYRALDALLPHKAALEVYLKQRLGQLFAIEYDLMLYDMTSTYFEGQAVGNPQARYGYSRDRRSDCVQVCIALVVTRDGLPLGYEVFAGNRSDPTTVREIVQTMEARYGRSQRVWVMDRGMASEANLAWLRAGDRTYVAGTPKSRLRQFAQELAEESGWESLRQGLEVKLLAASQEGERFVLCRSADRRQKEQAIRQRFATRIEEGLHCLAQRLVRAKKPLERGQVERQVGRLLGRNRRAAGGFVVEVQPDAETASGLRIEWKRKSEWFEWALLSEGCYLLRSNVREWTAEDFWQSYMQLTHAEAAFRIQKSPLALRPIWHQKQQRVQAHILVCFLAYVLFQTLAQWQRRARLGDSPVTILEELARIQSVDVVVPLVGGREVRLRCVVRPDRAQAILLDRLGLRLPKRLQTAQIVF